MSSKSGASGSKTPISGDFEQDLTKVRKLMREPHLTRSADPEIVEFLEMLLQMARTGRLTEVVGYARIGSGHQYFIIAEELKTVPGRLQELQATLFCYPRPPCH